MGDIVADVTTGSTDALRSGVDGKEIAERRLRDAIASGEFAPGQRLVESELSEDYQVTRNSARLALEALMAEGLVERIPNRGARVRKVSTAEAVAIMECRMVLDGLLARKAAEHATPDGVTRLRANGEEMARAVENGELHHYSELIQTHHAIVRDLAQHPVAARLVERLQAQIVRNQYQLSLRPGRAQESLAELRAVIEAIVAGDPELAEQATRTHLRGVIEAVSAEGISAA